MIRAMRLIKEFHKRVLRTETEHATCRPLETYKSRTHAIEASACKDEFQLAKMSFEQTSVLTAKVFSASISKGASDIRVSAMRMGPKNLRNESEKRHYR